MQKEDKLTELADKKPRAALVYGMAIAIGSMAVVIGVLFYWIKDLTAQISDMEVKHRVELSELNDKNQKRGDKKDSLSAAGIQSQFEKRASDQEDRIKELQKTVEALLSQSNVVNTKFQKMENKVDRVSGNTKKIEEVINP